MQGSEQILEKSVCKIIDSEGKVRGTGFFVCPEGYVVTCDHVIKACKGDIKVGIFGESESITTEIVREYESYDIAVLKINREDCPVLTLSTEWRRGDQVFSHGFSVQHSPKDFPQGFPMKSILSGTTNVEGLDMLVLENTEVDSGLSGAPAFNERTGYVIGILRLKYQEGLKALVIPTERLFEKWSELKKYHESIQEKNKTKPEIDIPDIQSVLKKGETKDGDFFKKEPEWVDFEQGFIFERKEVDDIIKKIENKNNKVQLVQGAPASGKSIILKNVGFRLANENKRVYMIELKRHLKSEVEHFFDNILKINGIEPIFIVDDAHLNLDDCEDLAEKFNSRGKGHLIIGSRETREISEEHPKEAAEYELLSKLSKTCIHIQAEDVTEGMIRTYLERQYHFDEDKIKTVSSNLDKYKNDLWLLSWALISYNKDKDSVVPDEIYENIADSIEKIKIGKEKELLINGEDVFLPLSIFYRYEIPIERYFLEEQLGIDKNIINQLIGLQEIAETKETKMLSLNHSSIAELYLGAYLRKSYLGRRIKKTILSDKDDEKDLEYCSFYRYLTTTYPENIVDVIISLDRDFSDEKGGLTLLRKLINIDKIQKSIEKGIEKEEDIEKVGEFVSDIARTSEVSALKLDDSVSSRIKKENDLIKIGKCVRSIAKQSKDMAMKLVDIVSSRIEREEDLIKIGKCVSDICSVEKDMAMKLIESISSKIEKENDIRKIGLCVWYIVKASKDVGLELFNHIKLQSLLLKIEKEQDIEKIRLLLWYIAWVSPEKKLYLLDHIKINTLSNKIENADIEKIVLLMENIGGTTKGSELCKRINIDALSSKINIEKDIKNIVPLVSVIARMNKDVAQKLVNRLASHIDINALLSKIGERLQVSVGSIDGSIGFSSKIEDEPDIDNIIDEAEAKINLIMQSNEDIKLKLANALSSKMEKEQDIEKINTFVWIACMAGEEVVLKLVDDLSSKINKEDMENIASLVRDTCKHYYIV